MYDLEFWPNKSFGCATLVLLPSHCSRWLFPTSLRLNPPLFLSSPISDDGHASYFTKKQKYSERFHKLPPPHLPNYSHLCLNSLWSSCYQGGGVPLGSVLGTSVFSREAHSLDEYKWLLSISTWISSRHLKLKPSETQPFISCLNKLALPLVSLITVNSIPIITVIQTKKFV